MPRATSRSCGVEPRARPSAGANEKLAVVTETEGNPAQWFRMVPFNPEQGLALLGELVRAAAPPAGEEEICDQGIAITARAVGASAGLILLFGPPRPHTATWG